MAQAAAAGARRGSGWIAPVALGVGVAFAGLATLGSGALAPAEQALGLELLFRLRGPVPPPEDVVVVALDEHTPQSPSAHAQPRWSRASHARVVRALARGGARLIVFDMTFEAPGVPGDDRDFAAALSEAGNVVLAASLRERPESSAASARRTAERRYAMRLPLPALGQAAIGCAPFPLPKAARVDHYWTFIGDNESLADTPTLPVLAFRLAADRAGRRPAAPAGDSVPDTPGDGGAPGRWPCGGEHDRAHARERWCSGAQARAPGDLDASAAHRRSLARVYCEDELRWLDFYGPARALRTVPYAQLLASSDGQGPGSPNLTFAGKVVFIGYSSATPGGQEQMRDDYRTVYSSPEGIDLSGVEIAATAFANLLEDRGPRPVPRGGAAAIVTAWGLALGIVARRLRPARAGASLLALAMAYLGLAAVAFGLGGWWPPLVVPLLVQAPLALLGGLALTYRATRRERESVKRAFSYFVPGALVEQVATGAGTMADNRHMVFGACLSTDVQNYTTVAEHMEPMALGALMNRYFAELFALVERSGGVVVDVVGDAMVAVWAQTPEATHVHRRACEAALDMLVSLDRFNHPSAGHPPLPTRFGLHAGDMLLGTIGGAGHFEYRAVGDIVNTASRIQALNKVLGTRLLASESVVAGLDGFVTRPLGSFTLPGKHRSVALVELMERDRGATPGMLLRLERFADALSLYAAGRWPEAVEHFTRLLEEQPTDGPTRFYAERCRRLLAEMRQPPPGWQPSIPIARTSLD